jgi:hypothetical protein
VQQAGPTDEAAEVDEAEEAAVEAELRQLRANIAAAKRECHRLRRAAAAASTEARRVTDAEALEEVTAVLANKDNLLDDARIMAHTGKQLEAGRRELERLKVVKAGSFPPLRRCRAAMQCAKCCGGRRQWRRHRRRTCCGCRNCWATERP